MIDNFNFGYAVNTTIDDVKSELSVIIDRNNLLIDNRLNDYNQKLNNLDNVLNEYTNKFNTDKLFFEWYISQPIYKKIWWSILNKDINDLRYIYGKHI